MIFQGSQFNYRATFRLWTAFFLALILTNCANESAPQGGKKDVTPPKPKHISPENKSLHFSTNKITITFDEFIKPTGFAQTLISPPLDKKPDFKISGKSLIIKLKSHLRDSTTYTINFAEDIKDVNEGNILNNFTYVFSTGDFIDSQKVSGRVIYAKDNTLADGVIVSLYPADSFMAVKRSKPFYFAKTDKSGNFKINNIKTGQYNIFALKDQNYNYLYDQPNEMIAFSDTAINLTDSIGKKAELYLFEENTKKLSFAGGSSIYPGFAQIYLTKPIKTFKVTSDISTDNDFWYMYPTKDTINYWFSNYYAKRAVLFPVANDTLTDTLRIELKYIPIDSMRSNPKYALQIGNQSNTSIGSTASKDFYNAQDLYKPLKISFNRPITTLNEAKALAFYQDSVLTDVHPKMSIDLKTKMFVNIDFTKTENASYWVQIPDSMFQDILGIWNKKYTYKFKTNSKDSYGNLRVILKNEHPEKAYVVKILDSNGDLVQEIPFSGEAEKKISIENIPAGNYKVSAIDDTNKNGEWDTGNLKHRIQPEKVINYKDTYNLKGGWDLDMEMKF